MTGRSLPAFASVIFIVATSVPASAWDSKTRPRSGISPSRRDRSPPIRPRRARPISLKHERWHDYLGDPTVTVTRAQVQWLDGRAGAWPGDKR